MRSLLLILCAIYFIVPSISQEQFVKSKIEKVKVFQNGAQVNRSAKVNILAGESLIVFDDIPVDVNEESILVSAIGDFMMLSVVHKIEQQQIGESNPGDLSQLNHQIKLYNDSINYENSRLEIYKSQLNLLSKLDNKFDPQDSFSLSDFKEAIDFQNVKLSDIKIKEIKSKDKILFYNIKIQEFNIKIANLPQKMMVSKRKIIIDVSSKSSTSGSFSISYYIKNAGWTSSYDIRVKDINNPIELSHKADVFQSTGENWESVHLSLSNGNPAQSGVKPNLDSYYIQYSAPVEILKLFGIKEDKNIYGTVTDKIDGQPLPGVSVQIQGASVGTITDLNGKFSILAPKGSTAILFSFIGYKNKVASLSNQLINIQLEYDNKQLDDVVVTAYGIKRTGPNEGKEIVPVNTLNNQTSVEFDIEVPYSIPSDGRKHAVIIRELNFPAIYQYYCVPKLDKDAFLIAKITNWESNDLSDGNANIYFEGTYLGKSQLNLVGIKDTLLLSLGRDKNIKIERTQLKDNFTKQLIGNKKTEEKGFQISIKNLKKQPINLLLEDQLPLSTIEDIEINPIDLNYGILDENSGKIKWTVNIESQKEKTISFKYSIKYPKDFKITDEK